MLARMKCIISGVIPNRGPMRSTLILSSSALLVVACSLAVMAQQLPPAARIDNFHETFHGQELVDPYHWLEDSSSSETRKWIDAQNLYTHTLLNAPAVRQKISTRLTEMMYHD